MVKKTVGQFIFYYGCLKKTKIIIKRELVTSLLVILTGIFLLPNIAYFSDITSQNLIELTNEERVKAGLSLLTANQLLAQAAYQKAQDILEQQSFQHNIKEQKFSNWIRDAGYRYSYVGENLAIDFITAEGVTTAWFNSPAHKKNLLDPNFKEIGIAVTSGEFQGQDTILVVQIFGAPPRAVVQPRVAGINYLDQSGWQTSNNEKEYLLTHSSANQSLLSGTSNKLVINPEPLNQAAKTNLLNRFFKYNNYLSAIINFAIIVISIILILSILYLYFFFFFRLTKLTHRY